jgi:hypothetical protein
MTPWSQGRAAAQLGSSIVVTMDLYGKLFDTGDDTVAEPTTVSRVPSARKRPRSGKQISRELSPGPDSYGPRNSVRYRTPLAWVDSKCNPAYG